LDFNGRHQDAYCSRAEPLNSARRNKKEYFGKPGKSDLFSQFPCEIALFAMLGALSKKPKQYFLAIIPPSPVFEEALELKNYFKERYNSKASLNSPPHITLHMPFRWKEEKENELIETLNAFASGLRPFDLQLLNFNSFPPRVIFIDVVANEQLVSLQKKLLRFCKKELNLFNADYKDQPFHPHLTLAFRDLKKSMFADAWGEFSAKPFSASFQVDKFNLLKHNGKVWQPYSEINLK
jgi:2'-5' RNA ligase